MEKTMFQTTNQTQFKFDTLQEKKQTSNPSNIFKHQASHQWLYNVTTKLLGNDSATTSNMDHLGTTTSNINGYILGSLSHLLSGLYHYIPGFFQWDFVGLIYLQIGL